MEPEPYQLFFDQSFNIGGYYTGAEIRETIDQGRTQNIAFPYENPMAYTYNRWNKGMNDIASHFVFLWNGKYEYIGRDQPYSGSIYHVPGKEEDRYVIGHFVEGAFALFDGFNSFKDWVSSDFNGHLAADAGKKIEVLFDVDIQKIIPFFWANTHDEYSRENHLNIFQEKLNDSEIKEIESLKKQLYSEWGKNLNLIVLQKQYF